MNTSIIPLDNYSDSELLDRLSGNYQTVQTQISAAAVKADRDPQSIQLVAAVKYASTRVLSLLAQAGVTNFGINRVADGSEKQSALSAQTTQSAICNPVTDKQNKGLHTTDITWHFIGHLQRNKAKNIVNYSYLHSLDSVELVNKLSMDSDLKQLQVFLQVNISGEVSKNGIAPEATLELARSVIATPNLTLCGLSTIAPIADNPESSRPVFRGLYQLSQEIQNKLNLPPLQLSMGMTDDFAVAISEGATTVRIGRALFL